MEFSMANANAKNALQEGIREFSSLSIQSNQDPKRKLAMTFRGARWHTLNLGNDGGCWWCFFKLVTRDGDDGDGDDDDDDDHHHHHQEKAHNVLDSCHLNPVPVGFSY